MDMQKIYPTTKLLVALLGSIALIILNSPLVGYGLVPVCLILAAMAGKARPFLGVLFKALLPLIAFIFLLQSFFYPGTTILWSGGIFTIKLEGVNFAIGLTSKLTGIASLLILFFQTTEMKALVRALEKLGMPPKSTFVVLSTMQLIKETRSLASTIQDAQRSRGVETEGNLRTRAKAFLPIITPLILGSIASTEERVLTLEARGFTVPGSKQRLYEVTARRTDYTIGVIAILLFISLIFLKVIT